MQQYLRAGEGALALLAAVLFSTASSTAAETKPIEGVFALPGLEQLAKGQLTLSKEDGEDQLKILFRDTAGKQIEQFDVELTQELHILAVDEDLETLVHRHVEHADNEGVFKSQFDFPAPGLYHVFADVSPTGIGQQVLRFDVEVPQEDAADAPPKSAPVQQVDDGGRLVSKSGAYTVVLDTSELSASQEGMMSLSVSKDGRPATDIEPYLGVAAHAVFVRAEDLAYVHAHAMTSEGENGHDAHAEHDGMKMNEHPHGSDESMGHHGMSEMASTEGSHDHASPGTHSSSAAVSPDMEIHVAPPAAGEYSLWVEFMAGGEVQTVPFKVEVPETQHSH